jgi:predicted RNA-binding Zn-ribbon protein involved in translation (DUF1610 family)
MPKSVVNTKLDRLLANECQCPKCGTILEREWENNGFDEPDPTHYEVYKEYCPECGYEPE